MYVDSPVIPILIIASNNGRGKPRCSIDVKAYLNYNHKNSGTKSFRNFVIEWGRNLQ